MIIDLYKGNAPFVNNFTPILVAFTSFAAGYTVSDFHPDFLKFFTTPVGQFIVYFVILYAMFRDDKTVALWEIVAEALLYVAILQGLKFTLNAVLPKYSKY